MVVYNVFSSCVCYQYKAYLCSKASAVLIITSILTVLFPIIFTYRSHGFWQRTDTYQEQPKVHFKYDYIIFFDVAKATKKADDQLVLCTNIPNLLHMTNNFNYCPFLKAYEDDFNEDGFNDALRFESKLFLSPGNTVKGVTLILLFDYKLSSYCRVQMEGMAYLQHFSPLPGAGIEVTADLSLVQRQPLNPRRIDTRYNTSFEHSTLNGRPFNLGEVLKQYSLRNLSTRLSNVYTAWTTKRKDSEPFKVHLNIIYSETTVRYSLATWQIIRLAWAQFFPVLILSILVFSSIKYFIFSNQLVNTYREEPWTKGH